MLTNPKSAPACRGWRPLATCRLGKRFPRARGKSASASAGSSRAARGPAAQALAFWAVAARPGCGEALPSRARGPGGRGARVALRVPQGLSEVRAWAAACFVCLLPTRKRPLGWQGPSGEGPGARPGVSPRFRRGGGLQLRCSWISRHPPLAPDPSPFHSVLSPACPGRPCEGAHAGRRGSGAPGAPVLSPVWGGGPRAGGAAFPDSGVGEGLPLQQSGSGAQPGPRPRVPYLFRPRPAFPAFRTHVTFPSAQSVPRGPEACAEAPGGASRSDTRTGRTRRRPPLPWPRQVGVTLLTSPRVQAPRQLP